MRQARRRVHPCAHAARRRSTRGGIVIRTVLALAALLLAPTATALIPSFCPLVDAPGCVPFARIAHGLHGADWGAFVIEGPEACEARWFRASCAGVDFATHWVAAVGLHRNTCCPELWVRDVLFDGATYVVTYDIGPFGIAQAFSQPYDVVAIERQGELPVVAVFVGPPQDAPPHWGGPLSPS